MVDSPFHFDAFLYLSQDKKSPGGGFSVSFANFLRARSLQNTSEQLLEIRCYCRNVHYFRELILRMCFKKSSLLAKIYLWKLKKSKNYEIIIMKIFDLAS